MDGGVSVLVPLVPTVIKRLMGTRTLPTGSPGILAPVGEILVIFSKKIIHTLQIRGRSIRVRCPQMPFYRRTSGVVLLSPYFPFNHNCFLVVQKSNTYFALLNNLDNAFTLHSFCNFVIPGAAGKGSVKFKSAVCCSF